LRNSRRRRGNHPDRGRRHKISRKEREKLTPARGTDEAGRAVVARSTGFLLWAANPGLECWI
jgi:hypothetical protein